MKSLIIITLILSTLEAFSFFNNVKFGAGTFTTDVGKVEEEIGGSTNKFEFAPFLKASFEFDIFWEQRLVFDSGLSFPKSSRDSNVKKMNFWTNLLFFNELDPFTFYYGLGFFFTRLSMDGKEQTLNNGGQQQQFQTPNGSSLAVNNVLILGTSLKVDPKLSIEAQTNVMNVEDSTERAFNYFISINYHLGNF